MLCWDSLFHSMSWGYDRSLDQAIFVTFLISRVNRVLTLVIKEEWGEQVRAELLQMRAEGTESPWAFGEKPQEKTLHSFRVAVLGEDLSVFF